MKKLYAALLLLLLIFFFFPKQYVKGGLAGEVGTQAYREEYDCLGVKDSYYPKDCADCPRVYNCYGITYGKKCYLERHDSSLEQLGDPKNYTMEAVACK